MGCDTFEVRRVHHRNFVKITIVVCLYVVNPDSDISLVATIERLCAAITEVLHANDQLALMIIRLSAHTQCHSFQHTKYD